MTSVDPVTGEVLNGDRLPVPAQAWDLEVGWFETQAAPWIDNADVDDVVGGWQEAVARDEYLDTLNARSVELVRAIRWAERRIGVELGDSKTGPRTTAIPNSVRNLDPKQRAQFRKMGRVDPAEFRRRLVDTDDRADLSRAAMARWAQRVVEHAAEQDARDAVMEATVADAEGDRWRLFHGDFRERLLELEPGSVDLILTDPPYPADFLPLWSDLAEIAARILKPQGVLAALTGQIYLPDVSNRLGEHLAYGWTYCQPLPGQQSRIMGRHVLQSWKPWLIYTNGTWPSGRIQWHPDMLDPSYRAKDQYRWQQDPNPTLLLIDALSEPDALVVDPFTGTGSYGVAALTMGRTFVGCELDLDRFEAGKKRLERGVS